MFFLFLFLYYLFIYLLIDLQCMPWAWYLANDMQFYVIAPAIIFTAYRYCLDPVLRPIKTLSTFVSLFECCVILNRSATLSKALKKVESLSSGSRIKFEFDQTFASLPCNFSLFSKHLDLDETV